MNLYIRLKNGQPFEHPVTEDNLSQAFPDLNLINLPEWVMPFERVECPIMDVYDVYEGVTYTITNNVCRDVHNIRPMTSNEKTAKQDAVKAAWVAGLNYQSWAFNETTCAFEAPVAYPTDNKIYRWDEATTTWIEVTA
jgi:hypothetical protein